MDRSYKVGDIIGFNGSVALKGFDERNIKEVVDVIPVHECDTGNMMVCGQDFATHMCVRFYDSNNVLINFYFKIGEAKGVNLLIDLIGVDFEEPEHEL